MKSKIKTIFKALESGVVTVSGMLRSRDIEYSGHENKSGDNQLKVDIRADNVFASIAEGLDIAGFASEEREGVAFNKKDVRFCHETLSLWDEEGLFLSFDPLDGSSLVDSNLTIGSIFGIYKGGLQGRNMVASMYALYGPRLEIVQCYDGKSSHYIHDGELVFLQDFQLGERGNINSPGGTQKDWGDRHRQYVQELFNEGYRLRYSGSMVADLHQILCKGGGVFSYPASISEGRLLGKGKLRNLFEVFPLALAFKYANGYATDSHGDVLDVHTNHVHDTTPCFFGSKYEIDKLKKFHL